MKIYDETFVGSFMTGKSSLANYQMRIFINLLTIYFHRICKQPDQISTCPARERLTGQEDNVWIRGWR